MVKDNTIELFLDDLASQKGTPGGGSAAALIGAIAAALVSMVCNLRNRRQPKRRLGSKAGRSAKTIV